MLNIEDLHVHYGGIHAVQGVNIAIPRGKIVTLIGANGAGKSSTIRAVAGLCAGAKGRVLHRRREEDAPEQLLGMPPENMVRRGIALCPEGRRILPHLTVEENLRLGAYIRDDAAGIARDMQQVYDLFPRLRERSWQKGGTLSGGEQQMLAVGRALMSSPDLIMLDEPSLGLAPLLVKEIFRIIVKINAAGRTVLLVEQNALAALSVAHYAYVLEVGRVAMAMPAKELMNNPKVRDTYNSNYFQKRVAKAVEAGFIRLIFQCGGLNYVSSTGIGSFTAFLKLVKPRGGDLVLLEIQPKVYEVFQLLGFSQFFNIKDNLEDSVSFFKSGTSPEKASLFPNVFSCPICSKKLKAVKPGRFRCSECKTILAIDNAAQVFLG